MNKSIVVKDNIRLSISVSNFTKILEEDRIFIDKTLFLKEIIDKECPPVIFFVLKCFIQYSGNVNNETPKMGKNHHPYNGANLF